MKMKTAVFESKWGSKSVWDSVAPSDDYFRLSEWVEIDYPELSKEEIVGDQVRLIDKEIKDISAKAERTITTLKQKREELLALPAPRAA